MISLRPVLRISCFLWLWSNLALMTSTLAIGGVLGLTWFYKLFSERLDTGIGKSVIAIGLLFILPHLYAIYYSLELKTGGMLYLGEQGSFVDIVLNSLFLELSGGTHWFNNMLRVFVGVYVIVSITLFAH